MSFIPARQWCTNLDIKPSSMTAIIKNMHSTHPDKCILKDGKYFIDSRYIPERYYAKTIKECAQKLGISYKDARDAYKSGMDKIKYVFNLDDFKILEDYLYE